MAARKQRTPLADALAADVLVAADRTCCVCRRSKRVQVHHIDGDPSNNIRRNLAVLCLDCHNEAHRSRGFARGLDGHQIQLYRDNWDEVVASRRRLVTHLGQTVMPQAHADLTVAAPDLTSFLDAFLAADYNWSGAYVGEFGRLGARYGDALYQVASMERADRKPSYYQTYWGLSTTKWMKPNAYRLQADLTHRTIAARFAGRRWIQVALDDYAASPATVTRRVETVRHTVRAVTILLLTAKAPEIVAQTAWGIVEEASQLMNSDGGWSEFRPNTGESTLYATLYIFHFLSLLLRDGSAPGIIPEWQTFEAEAHRIRDRAQHFLQAQWELQRWRFGDMPWEVNAPIILAEVGPHLTPDLRDAAYDVLHQEISPTGRLRNPDVGNAWDAPEYVRAVRVAFALSLLPQRPDGTSRLARLQDWIFAGATHEEPVRTCDVAFLAEMWRTRGDVAPETVRTDA